MSLLQLCRPLTAQPRAVIWLRASRFTRVGFLYVAFIGLSPCCHQKVEWTRGTVIRRYTDQCAAYDLLNFSLWKFRQRYFCNTTPCAAKDG